MALFNLEIVTPLKVAYKDEVKMIIARTIEGNIGVLSGHAPLVTELAIGEMVIKKEESEQRYFIAGGFLEISKDKVIILADKAMKAEDINIEEEKRKKEIMEAKSAKISEDREIVLMQKELQEVLTKIRIGERLM
jgi:F-type H+-transporting ATPase subunit epsilon